MISAYASIVSYQHDDWEEYFDRIAMIEIFKPVIDFYKEDKVKLKCVIQYILHCYSVESDKVKIGLDWQKNKLEIFEDTCMPLKELMDDTVYLKNYSVITVINSWLQFQDSEVFAELCMLKDLKLEMQLSATSIIRKSSGEIDYDQKYKNSTYVTELRKKVRDLESEFIQNNVKLKDAVKEFKTATKSKSTLSAAKAFSNE
jgi:hypothetical protein